MTESYAADSYEGTRSTSIPAHGAGNNPSTYAGIIVIGAVLFLAAARRSLRKYL